MIRLPKFIGVIAIGCAVLAAAGCSMDDSTSTNQSVAQQQAQTCTPALSAQSSELNNICERYSRLNDKNHISYIYWLANTGAIIAEYQVIGKCSSTDSNVIPDMVPSRDSGYTGGAAVTVPNRQLDGSYGPNEPAIYCFLNNKAKTMVEWNGLFIWQDTPLPLTTPPSIVMVYDGK